MTLLKVLLVITAISLFLLLLKSKLQVRICAICLAVSLTWAGLLAAYHMGWFGNGLLLGLLMGQSITGIYYLLEKHASEPLLLFRLPLLLSLTYFFLWSAYIASSPLGRAFSYRPMALRSVTLCAPDQSASSGNSAKNHRLLR
jgi:cbb3-type cytochrome oxidase subunit 1